ncbi:MAG: LiaI-LiaF-like domain-containing protein [bacterium]
MEKREKSFTPGVILIVIGLYFLLDQLNLFHFSWREIFPVALLLLGSLFLVSIFTRKDKSAAFPATVLLVLGAFYFLRNFDLLPYDFYLYRMRDYWPVFLIAFGLGFIVLFLLNTHDWGLMIPGGLLLFFGVTFLLDKIGFLYWDDFVEYWPVILIAIGTGIVVANLRKKAEQEKM